MPEQWYAIYDTTSGFLYSVGTVITDPLPPGTAALELPGEPTPAVMWDEATRNFILRPPKILIDRLQDIIAHADYADFKAVWDKLTPVQKEKVRNALIKLLGRARWRNVSESITVEE